RYGPGDEFRRVALRARLVFPLPGLEPALDIDLAALAQVFGCALCERTPGDDPEPLRLFLPRAILTLEVAVHGDRELGHGLTARRRAHLRITAEIADDHHLVE